MSRTLTKFSQTKLAKIKGLNGGAFCLALSGAWVYLIAKGPMGSWAVPKQTPKSRLGTLEKKAVKLHQLHKQYLGRQREVSANAERIEALLMVARSGFLGLEDRGNLINMLEPEVSRAERFGIVDVKGIHLQKSALLLLQKLGLKPVSVKAIAVTDIDAAKHIVETYVKNTCVYVIMPKHGTTTGEHAMAIYRTDGVFSTYFYIFDPNYGEVVATTADDAAWLVERLMGSNSPYKTQQWNLVRCSA